MVTKVKLSRWEGHLAQAQADGVTLAQYARKHELSKATLYAARQQQGSKGWIKGVVVD